MNAFQLQLTRPIMSTTILTHADDTLSHYVLASAGSMLKTSSEQRSRYSILETSNENRFSRACSQCQLDTLAGWQPFAEHAFRSDASPTASLQYRSPRQVSRRMWLPRILFASRLFQRSPCKSVSVRAPCLDKCRGSQISSLLCTVAVTFRRRQFPQPHLSVPDSLLMPLQNVPRLLFTPGDILILPTAWPPAVPVLHQQMRGADLARRRLGAEVLSNVFT